MFSGDLSLDAPGLCTSLSRAKVPAEVILAIREAYSTVCRTADLSEMQNSLRIGTSFNPRPARLIIIALRELKISEQSPELLPLLVTLAHNPKQTTSELSALGLAVVMIDDLRHAHLMTPTSDFPPVIDPSLLQVLPARLAAVLTTAHANALMLREQRRAEDREHK